MKTVRVIRVDPARQLVAVLQLLPKKDATPQLRRMIRQNQLGEREITAASGEGAALIVIGGLNVDQAMSGWRIRGGVETGGIGVLAGKSKDGLLVDVPVAAPWVRANIRWLDSESVDDCEERAQHAVSVMNDELRGALSRSVPTSAGTWILADDRPVVGTAFITLGVGTDASGGQMLTPMGIVARDLLLAVD